MDILSIPMQRNDAGASTIKEYLKKLLYTLYNEGEGFSGKRPFGNSGWEYELYLVLLNARAVDGKLTEDGYIDTIDRSKANYLIFQAIESL